MATTRWMAGPLIALALAAAVPAPAHAQDRLGGVLEWIHRLSGPQFIGPAVSYARGNEAARFRLSGAYRWSFSSEDQIDPSDAGLTMFSLTPAGEFRVWNWLEAGAGVGAHRYGGDADGFWHWSIPLYAQAMVPMSDRLDARIGLGWHYFFEFGADDFAPLVVTAPRDGGEWVFTLFGGVDVKLF